MAQKTPQSQDRNSQDPPTRDPAQDLSAGATPSPTSQSDAPPLVALITAPPAEAAALAEHLVAEQLVACVNLLPAVQSFFRWQGAIEREEESLLICKTTPEAWPRLAARLPELHPYEVPEGIALPCSHALAPYARWVAEECRAGDRA